MLCGAPVAAAASIAFHSSIPGAIKKREEFARSLEADRPHVLPGALTDHHVEIANLEDELADTNEILFGLAELDTNEDDEGEE